MASRGPGRIGAAHPVIALGHELFRVHSLSLAPMTGMERETFAALFRDHVDRVTRFAVSRSSQWDQPRRLQPATSAYALAAWTARPTSADPAQISAAEAHSAPSVGDVGATQPAASDKQGPRPAGGPWSPVLVDSRGDLTLALYSGDGTATTACLAGPSFVWLNPIDTSSEPPVSDNTASLDEVTIRGTAGDVYAIAVGRSGSAVTGVELQRVDGSAVSATVSDGRFLAWWPQSEGVKALSVTTSAGTRDYPVDQRFARSGSQPTNRTVRSLSDQPTKAH